VCEVEEHQLLAACRRGDPTALRQLVETHYDPLYRFLWRLTASPESAAELTQEAFVRALERLPSFKGRARFSTWLHAIALNLWKDARRRLPWEGHGLFESAPAPGGEQEALARLERDEVRRAVERLPDAQRAAILLFYYEGKSHREIAQICGCPLGTVGTRIHHGLRALRRMLGAPGCGRAPLAQRSRCP
jgi:RNA polymerase sigma-70 factor, ECF subfamily